jgi:hypothetical protein
MQSLTAFFQGIFQHKATTPASIIFAVIVYWSGFQTTQETAETNAIEVSQLVIQVSSLTDQIGEISDQLYEMKYEPAYKIIKLGLAGKSHDEAIERIKFWVDEDWVAKIVNLTELCEEPSRKYLMKIGGPQGAVDYCRALS